MLSGRSLMMKLSVSIPIGVCLAVATLAYNAESSVRPLGMEELQFLRGGQATGNSCLAADTPGNCPVPTSGACSSAKCTIQPDNTIACSFGKQSVSLGTYQRTKIASSGENSATTSVVQCTTYTPCLGGCATVPGQGSSLYCATGGQPRSADPVQQSVLNDDPCLKGNCPENNPGGPSTNCISPPGGDPSA